MQKNQRAEENPGRKGKQRGHRKYKWQSFERDGGPLLSALSEVSRRKESLVTRGR